MFVRSRKQDVCSFVPCPSGVCRIVPAGTMLLRSGTTTSVTRPPLLSSCLFDRSLFICQLSKNNHCLSHPIDACAQRMIVYACPCRPNSVLWCQAIIIHHSRSTIRNMNSVLSTRACLSYLCILRLVAHMGRWRMSFRLRFLQLSGRTTTNWHRLLYLLPPIIGHLTQLLSCQWQFPSEALGVVRCKLATSCYKYESMITAIVLTETSCNAPAKCYWSMQDMNAAFSL